MIVRQRIQTLRRCLQANKLKAAFLTSATSRRYFTGFTGTTGWVLVTADAAILFTDFRYTERAVEETSNNITVVELKTFHTQLKEVLRDAGMKKLGIEDREMTVAMHQWLQKIVPRISLLPLRHTVEEIRAIKDEEEVVVLKRAIVATDLVFKETHHWLRQCVRTKRLPTETMVSWKVRDLIHTKKLGELSFDTIVASGPNAARPHHEPTSRRIKVGDPVIIDLGVAVDGYHADMTRTVFIGQPRLKLKMMYETTLRAQQAAFQYIKKGGRSAAKADAAARAIIDERFPNSFGHALGHGVGLEVHEHPTLSPKSPHTLKSGMVFSIEPGIYLSNSKRSEREGEAHSGLAGTMGRREPQESSGGIRIEDLILLTKKGPEYLSRSPKNLKSMIL